MRSFVRKKFIEAADFGPLRIRLQRFGQTNFAFYNLVATQARFRRNGRYHDLLGTYCPHATDAGYKHINLDFQKIKQWLAVGARPSETAAKLLSKAGLLPSRPRKSEIMQQLAKQRQVASERASQQQISQ